MRVQVGGRLRSERGATLAVVAVCLIALLGIMALAIDLGMLYKTRADAQRAADAAALAGASVYIDFVGPSVDTAGEARQRAIAIATHNTMFTTIIDSSEVYTKYIPAKFQYRVWIRRENVPTWFAHILGRDGVPVMASATAEATNAGSAKCVKPFLIPDYWDEKTGEDKNPADRIWEPPVTKGNKLTSGEVWTYTPGSDRYVREGDGTASNPATGFGSTWRDGRIQPGTLGPYAEDQGRQIQMYPQSPQDSPGPSFFYLFDVASIFGAKCPGGQCVQQQIEGCAAGSAPVKVGDEIPVDEQPGGKVGPVTSGFDSLLSLDESAHWVESKGSDGIVRGTVVSNNPAMNGLANPRVIIAALFDPQFIKPGKQTVPVNNLALFFLESAPRKPSENKNATIARFLQFATGGEGPTSGSLIKVLRLVQ